MNQKLKKLLLKLTLNDLRQCLDKDVVDTADYLRKNPKKSELIDIALNIHGVLLLKSKKLRLHLLMQRSCEDLKSTAFKLNINCEKTEDILLKLSEISFSDSPQFRVLLDFLNLGEKYLPRKKIKEDDPVIETAEMKNAFWEQLDYQFDIRRRVIKRFREMADSRCIMHMPTGAGKTKTAMHILNELMIFDYKKQGYVLWLAHSEELLTQAIETFKDVWKSLGKFNVDLVRLWGRNEFPESVSGSAFIFSGISKLQSIHKRKPELLQKISSGLNVIVVDECHRAPANETKQVLDSLLQDKNVYGKQPNLLGLTATPGRRNGFDIEDQKLRRLFDNEKFTIDIDLVNKYNLGHDKVTGEIQALQKRKILSTFKRRPITIAPETLGLTQSEIVKLQKSIQQEDSKKIDSSIMLKIAKNKERNRKIIDKLFKLSGEQKKILFFACNVEHAKMINSALLLENIKSGLVLGETNVYEKRETIEQFKNSDSGLNVLINVSVLTTGFDAPNIDCIFIGRPISSIVLYSQIIGRGIRGPLMGGKEECLLIDVIDNVTLGDESWAFNYFDSYWQ